jgi:alpha-tubulin suppressor-like RCC1 family protein
MGGFHSVAISEYGKIFTWGYNQYRQLGLGDSKHRYIPTEVQAAFHPILPEFPFSLGKLLEFEEFSDLTIFGNNTASSMRDVASASFTHGTSPKFSFKANPTPSK